MQTAVGYVRRSTDRQDESLTQQRNKLAQCANVKGWELTRIFEDDAISGSEMKRPGLEALLAAIENDKSIQVVVVWERNRLSRPKDPLDGMLLERKILNCGKRVFYAATGQEADRSLGGGLLGYVEHFQNGDYLRKLSRDTMRGQVSRAERGFRTGGPVPFGYDRLILNEEGVAKRIVRDMPDGTQLVIDPQTAEVIEHVTGAHRFRKQEYELCSLVPSESARVQAIQKIFADYAAGVPLRRIRDEVNKTGLRTHRGRCFAISGLDAILENPAYLGRCVFNRRTESKWHRHSQGQSIERQDEGLEVRPESDWVVTENAWPAIIDEDTFARVQHRRSEAKEKYRQVVGKTVHSSYLLTGIMTCGVCGGPLFGMTTKSGKGYRTRYYSCTVHHRGEHERCPKRYTVPADRIEEILLTKIKSDLTQIRDNEDLYSYVEQEVKRVTGERGETSGLLLRRQAELEKKLGRIREHLQSIDHETAITLGLYEEAESTTAEYKAVRQQVEEEAVKLPQLPPVERIRENVKAALSNLGQVLELATIEERRELIRKYLRAVEVNPDRKTVRVSLFTALFNKMVAGAGG